MLLFAGTTKIPGTSSYVESQARISHGKVPHVSVIRGSFNSLLK